MDFVFMPPFLFFRLFSGYQLNVEVRITEIQSPKAPVKGVAFLPYF